MISLFSVCEDVDRKEKGSRDAAPRAIEFYTERTVHPSARKSKNIIFQALSIVVPQILMNTVTIIKHGNPRISNTDHCALAHGNSPQLAATPSYLGS